VPPIATPTPTPAISAESPRPAAPPTATRAPVAPASTLQRRDLNRDGRLNLVEWRLWLGPKAELRDWDRNGDGEVDRTEFEAFTEANPGR